MSIRGSVFSERSDVRAAVFLDRDDTLIRNMPYLGDPAGVEVLSGVADGLARLRGAAYMLVLASNQSGVGRGLITKDQVAAVNTRMQELLGLDLDAVYACYAAPEDPYGAEERKPSPAMLVRAAADHGIDLRRSFMVGDRLTDVRCGRAAGCRTVWVAGGTCDNAADSARAREEADFVAADFGSAVKWILENPT